MKRAAYLILLIILGIALFLSLSCTKEKVPTLPNFEEGALASNVWEFDHILWFHLTYVNVLKGIANVDITMSAKGESPNASLKIGTQDISFQTVSTFTDGKLYYGGSVTLNTDQAVLYQITNGDNTYSGTVTAMPQEINVATWPEFNQNVNYSVSWVNTPDPNFHVVKSMISGEGGNLEMVKQISGNVKDYTLLQTFWAGILPIDYFQLDINAISYEMKNSNKVLIVGQTTNSNIWGDKKNNTIQNLNKKPFEFIDIISEDIRNHQ
jgi:hypothetical protein